jgi:hypothetical protein
VRSSVLARILGFRQRIIPEPHVPSRGTQVRGTRLRPFLHPSPGFSNVLNPPVPIERVTKVPIERVTLTEYNDVNFIEFPDL